MVAAGSVELSRVESSRSTNRAVANIGVWQRLSLIRVSFSIPVSLSLSLSLLYPSLSDLLSLALFIASISLTQLLVPLVSATLHFLTSLFSLSFFTHITLTFTSSPSLYLFSLIVDLSQSLYLEPSSTALIWYCLQIRIGRRMAHRTYKREASLGSEPFVHCCITFDLRP